MLLSIQKVHTDAFVISSNRQTLLFSLAWILNLRYFKGLKLYQIRAWCSSEGSNSKMEYYLKLQSHFLYLYDMIWDKDLSIEGAVVPWLLLCSMNKAKDQEQVKPAYKSCDHLKIQLPSLVEIAAFRLESKSCKGFF